MQKLLPLLVLLLTETSASAEDFFAYSWADLKTYLNSSDRNTKTCVLMADIDFQGEDFEPLISASRDILSDVKYKTWYCINGNYHTIKNGTADDGYIMYYASAGTIKNLTFEGISSSCSILTYYAATGCHFENLTFNNCHVKDRNACRSLVCVESYGTSEQPLNFKDITVTNCSVEGFYCIGTLIASSNHSTKVTNCHVSGTTVEGTVDIGGLVGFAKYCNFDNCSFSGKVYASGDSPDDAECGGIAGWNGYGSFSNCINKGEIVGNEDAVGGIVGSATKISITGCTNEGWVHHKSLSGTDDRIGGIVGYADGVTISQCINTGSIDGGDECCGGIAGSVEGTSTITHCLNNGFVNGDDYVGGIAGMIADATTVSFCIGVSSRIYGNDCVEILVGKEPTGSTHDNFWIAETSNINVGAVTAADLKSGLVAWHINQRAGLPADNLIWGQLMANRGVGIEDYPTPGGKTVYRHTSDCKDDDHEFYSNNLHNHFGDIILQTDGTYICTYCNKVVEDGESVATGYTIFNAQDLSALAAYVNAGNSSVNACLYDDIDCSSLTTFAPIGNQEHTYCGTFDGQGHRITNLHISGEQNGLGLCGALGHGATIRNLILDASCSVTGTKVESGQAGIGGIAGCVYAPEALTYVRVNFENCGNEADVSGFSNVGGILGGVYNNNNIRTFMTCCYNTGTIISDETSAALAGWLYKWFEIKNCWNGGGVTVTNPDKKDNLVFRRADDASLSGVSKVYSTVGQENDGVITITRDDIELGRLCYLLNGSTNKGSLVWGQQLEAELHPTFSGEGVSYTRTMSNQWGTICLPYAIQSNGDVQLYTLTSVSTGDNGSMVFTPNDNIVAANTPCVFKKKSSSATSVTFSPSNAVYTIGNNPAVSTGVNGWTMCGTYTELTNRTNLYFVARDQFWWAESPITIAPFRAWFTGPAPSISSNAGLRISVADDAEGISAVRSEELGARSGFDLMGRQTNEGQTGLQIRNGKVVMIK